MATTAEKKRLVEAIAYIRTHRRMWNQGMWVVPEKTIGKCGTVGCLAGHIAITLNSSKPVINVPGAVFRKAPSKRTPEEQLLVRAAYSASEYVKPTGHDDQSRVFPRYFGEIDEEIKVIHVKDRAQRLLGDLVTDRELNNGEGLFSSNNDLNDLYRIAANKLGITVKELKDQCDEIASKRGWTESKASA